MTDSDATGEQVHSNCRGGQCQVSTASLWVEAARPGGAQARDDVRPVYTAPANIGAALFLINTHNWDAVMDLYL